MLLLPAISRRSVNPAIDTKEPEGYPNPFKGLVGLPGLQFDVGLSGKRYHYEDHTQLERHLANFIAAYEFGRRLKTLKGLTLYEFICKCWTSEPQRFTLNPIHQMPGLNT